MQRLKLQAGFWAVKRVRITCSASAGCQQRIGWKLQSDAIGTSVLAGISQSLPANLFRLMKWAEASRCSSSFASAYKESLTTRERWISARSVTSDRTITNIAIDCSCHLMTHSSESLILSQPMFILFTPQLEVLDIFRWCHPKAKWSNLSPATCVLYPLPYSPFFGGPRVGTIEYTSRMWHSESVVWNR